MQVDAGVALTVGVQCMSGKDAFFLSSMYLSKIFFKILY